MRNNYFKSFIVFLLTLILVTGAVEISFADATTSTRSGCSWISKRYKATAKIKERRKLRNLSKDKDSSCSRAIAHCAANCRGTNIVVVADIGSGGDNSVISGSTSLCNSGIGLSELEANIIENMYADKVITPGETTGSSLFFDQKIDDENRLVNISNARGELFVLKNYPGFTELRFIIWKAKDDYENGIADDEITEDKTVTTEYIRIRNNQFEVSEGLKNAARFVVEETD